MYTLQIKKLSTTPIADIKTRSEVEPAEMNGNSKPVGGTTPLNISYCIIKVCIKKRANLLLFLLG